jgi:enamine deaminase RidA (YjgF/YER057c/UK114 family)
MRIDSMMTVLALLIGVSTAQAEVVRHPIPNSSFPISQSVEVSGNVTTYFVSGQVPPVGRQDRRRNDPASLRRHQDPDRRRAQQDQRHS